MVFKVKQSTEVSFFSAPQHSDTCNVPTFSISATHWHAHLFSARQKMNFHSNCARGGRI